MSTVTKEDLDPRPMKRWKVGVVMMKMEVYTIKARTPEQAAEGIKKGMGRLAGSTPPVVQEFQVIEMGDKGVLPDAEQHIIKRPNLVGPGGQPI